jgi:putative tryptophan/tyrosine transport system substrate-binding protein
MTKRILLLCLFGLWLAIASSPVRAQTKSVTVFGYQQDETLLENAEGVREVLRAAGFREGRNLKLTVTDAKGSSERANQVALELVRGRPDILITHSLPAAQAVLRHTSKIPVIVMGLSDPVGLGLVAQDGPSGTNVTGVLDTISWEKRIALIKQVDSQARRIGVIYNPNDTVSVARVREFQAQLSAVGLIAIEVTVLRASEVGSAARNLIEKVDVFQTFTDVTVGQAYASLVQVANDAKRPLLGWDVKDVRAGAVAAIDLTDSDLGAAAGRLALRILRGANPGAIAPEVVARPPVYVNALAAEKQGVKFSPALSKTMRVLVK